VVQTSIGRHWREIDALLRERVECAHLCRVDWRGREELWHLTRYVPDRLATELAGLSRAGGEGGSQSVPNDSRLTSPEESFDKWSDAVLLDSARRIAQEFRKASADLVRLEADLARRQLASASEITARSRAGGHAATSAAAPSRGTNSGDGRDRRRTWEAGYSTDDTTLTERESSLPGELELLAAEAANVAAMATSVFR
jgi:hypothetical protein